MGAISIIKINKESLTMPTWDDYKKTARERGSLAFELYLIETIPIRAPAEVQKVLPAHIAYQQKLAAKGKIFMAGPISDQKGTEMQGTGMIFYRASSMDEAREWADGDPMHSQNVKVYTLRKWMINECTSSLISEIEKIRDA